jgi:hypothetical protein
MDKRKSIVEMVWILHPDGEMSKIGKRRIFIELKNKNKGWLKDGRQVKKIKGKWTYQAV